MESDRISGDEVEELDALVARPARRAAWVERLLAALLLPALLVYALADWQGQERRAAAYQAGITAAAGGHWATARTAFAQAGAFQDAPARAVTAGALSAALPDIVFLRRHGPGAGLYQMDAEGRATYLPGSQATSRALGVFARWPDHLPRSAVPRGAPAGGRSPGGEAAVFFSLINERPWLIWQPLQPADPAVPVPVPAAAWRSVDFWFAPSSAFLVLQVQQPAPMPAPPVEPAVADVYVLPVPPAPGSRLTRLARIAPAPSADWPTLALPASGALAVYVTPDRRLQARLFSGTITSTLATDVDAVWSLHPVSACARCKRVVARICATCTAALIARTSSGSVSRSGCTCRRRPLL
jgi:hypothetical protein